jgi:hypothetical protein
MLLSGKKLRVLAFGAFAFAWAGTTQAEVELGKAAGWTITTDGRVNGFISHIWGDDRPKGFESLAWMAFNEAPDTGQADKDGKLQKTRIRSGYVPSTLAFNLRKELRKDWFYVAARTEIGFQIANMEPVTPSDTTWMQPRSVYLDLSGVWGSLRAGRDLSLFPRSNLLMNYELGHAYGVGFPCSYYFVFGGACGHVGFGTLWPDFRAQITYSTPNFGDVFQVSVGMFDPRTVPTINWTRTPYPRIEGEAVGKYNFSEGWGFKAWANGAYQPIGIGYDILDPMTNLAVGREDRMSNAYGVGGGLQGYLGPVKAGVSGYMGRGMDAFVFLGFNPINFSRDSNVENPDRKLRPARGFLAEASVTIGSTWVMGGFGKAFLDRMPSDVPIQPRSPEDINQPPLQRTQTGISAGIFHRIDQVVFGIDYFNAQYGFDPRFVDDNTADEVPGSFVDSEQTVNTLNGGVTLEW